MLFRSEDLDAVLKSQIRSAMGLMTQITQNPRFADFMKESPKPQKRKVNPWAKKVRKVAKEPVAR